MYRRTVTSSNVRAVGYDELTKTLEVEFINGAVYSYSNVPEVIFTKLMTSKSIGKAVHELLRDKFETKKIK